MTPAAFHFRGSIQASKSILNRLLVIQSYEPSLEILGGSDADDVQRMKGALKSLAVGAEADCGAAGTTFRFLALKASRIAGRHVLRGTPRLFARPQSELAFVLEQLGCRAEFHADHVVIQGEGWKVPESGLEVPRGISSQFASAVVLNAWRLEKPLLLHFSGDPVSESYFKMTLELAKRAGLEWKNESASIFLPARAQVRVGKFECEIDVSSAFAVAALAVAGHGLAEIERWPTGESLQPDSIFPGILAEMGCEISLKDRVLSVSRSGNGRLRAVRWNLRESPDLFPVLGALCALAEGRSELVGAPHLAHKESSRIAKTAELVRLVGAKAEEKTDGMVIEGVKEPLSGEIVFDPDHDHRLAMAAAVVRAAGAEIQILHRDVVNKSFPSFWSIAKPLRRV